MSLAPRSCGACTLCCKVMTIRQLDKPAGVACVHIVEGRGCGAYYARPSACRVFVCGWLRQPGMPEALRPDRIGVVLQMEQATRLIARADPDDPAAWRRDPIYGVLKTWAAKAWPAGSQVLAAVGDRYWAVTPTPGQADVALGVLALDTLLEFDLLDDGRLAARVAGRPV
jgi:hypothetical protein